MCYDGSTYYIKSYNSSWEGGETFGLDFAIDNWRWPEEKEEEDVNKLSSKIIQERLVALGLSKSGNRKMLIARLQGMDKSRKVPEKVLTFWDIQV